MRTLPTGGFGTNKQPVILGAKGPQVPGTAMKRGIGTASTGARPMTAVSGAGFNSKQMSGTSAESSSAITVTLEPKIET